MTEKSIRPSRLTSCPTCKKNMLYDVANPFRPFCSDRCKNEDIIAWADGGFRIAGKPVDPDAEDGNQGPFRSANAADEDGSL